MATIEQASYCPKCKQQGVQVNKKPGSRGTTVYVLHCQNEVCPWLGSGWLVQVESDGTTVKERDRGPKQFDRLTNTDKAIAERLIREVRPDA